MLEAGQIIQLPQGEAEVISVDEFRACVKMLKKQKKSFAANGHEITFSSGGREFNISPNSEVKILRRQNEKS